MLTQKDYNFIFDAAKNEVKTKPDLRFGQSFFNILYDLRPDIANEIRGTERDMFYKDEISESFINRFVDNDIPDVIATEIYFDDSFRPSNYLRRK